MQSASRSSLQSKAFEPDSNWSSEYRKLFTILSLGLRDDKQNCRVSSEWPSVLTSDFGSDPYI